MIASEEMNCRKSMNVFLLKTQIELSVYSFLDRTLVWSDGDDVTGYHFGSFLQQSCMT